MSKIKVVDALCGSGKTSAAINLINSSTGKFLFITPLLSEVQRIKESCPDKHFLEPESRGSKLHDVKRLFQKGRNIVTTHALFELFCEDVVDIIKEQGYTLIIDESLNVIEQYPMYHKDVKLLCNGLIDVRENGLAVWRDKYYEGIFSDLKSLCDNQRICVYMNSALLQILPVSVFTAFQDIYLLTYMFDCQIIRYYFDLYGLSYRHIYVKDGHFTLEPVQYNNSSYVDLIHIVEHAKLNEIGESKYALSKSWFEHKPDDVDQLRKNLVNYYRKIACVPTAKTLWTTYKTYQDALVGKGYQTTFLACNARATNDYVDRVALAYALNRYANPIIRRYFQQHNITLDEDGMALSEMIQWVFRSAVRQEHPVNIYIPSKRMRDLMQNWLDSLK